jgi:rhodanese-related sulfurtransferase
MLVASQTQNYSSLRSKTASEIRNSLLKGQEIALLDVREEALFAEAHPLFAANLSLSRLELDVYSRLPRKAVPIVLFDDGENHAAVAAQRLSALGYTNVSLLDGGLQGWRDAGFEIFRDVNSPSKAFGELVEAHRHTPSLSAPEVNALIEAGADIVVVDVRRYDEFQTMSIPTAISAPGGELVYRLQDIADRPATHVIVNCAGRTRSIIGAQSLINAGLPNRVTALRNGTIGWKLAHQILDHGATREAPVPAPLFRAKAAAAARRVADSADVLRVSMDEVAIWIHAAQRTVYLFDVRTPAEYIQGHLVDFRNAPGGQLVQETDMFAPVRGAKIVLADTDGARANMTASWLSQMNWEVYVLDGAAPDDFNVSGDQTSDSLNPNDFSAASQINVGTLHHWLSPDSAKKVSVLDFSHSREYRGGHIPTSWFALRSHLDEALDATKDSELYVVTAREELAAYLAWKDLTSSTSKPVYLLAGGVSAWTEIGHALQAGEQRFASPPADYYRRPYEGTDASPEAMQAYLDWEFGLVDQLQRDGTHGFWVLQES